jgi:hypothetical protein
MPLLIWCTDDNQGQAFPTELIALIEEFMRGVTDGVLLL